MNFIRILIPSHREAKYSPGLMSAHSPGRGCLHCGCTASQMPSELTEPPVCPAQASVTNKKYNTVILNSSLYQKRYRVLKAYSFASDDIRQFKKHMTITNMC